MKIKKSIMACSILGLTLISSIGMNVNANTITKYGNKAYPNHFTDTTEVYAWTGTNGGYAKAQVTLSGILNLTPQKVLCSDVGYNSWAQTEQKSYSNNVYTHCGEHFGSNNEYKSSGLGGSY